ncbi:MAG: hypothetical protein JO227_12380 [Acetobacteraceae bacterium]|nr:hypothetical protein [Acetobacteraceae bacterium]
MITNEQLRAALLPPAMKHYFDAKLAPLPADEIDRRIEEALKYLNMSIHCPGEIPVSREIDELWHYWILETREYQQLCAKLPGSGFVHHSSADYAAYFDQDAQAQKLDVRRGVSILSSYVLNYGPFEPDRVRYWPLASRLMDKMGWDVDQLNSWLQLPESAPASAAD